MLHYAMHSNTCCNQHITYNTVLFCMNILYLYWINTSDHLYKIKLFEPNLSTMVLTFYNSISGLHATYNRLFRCLLFLPCGQHELLTLYVKNVLSYVLSLITLLEMLYPIQALHFTSTCVPQMSVDCEPNRNWPPTPQAVAHHHTPLTNSPAI